MSHIDRSVSALLTTNSLPIRTAKRGELKLVPAILGDMQSCRQPSPNAPYLPTQSQIQRILAPHQTITERNQTQNFLSRLPHPVWIRTCYAAELDPAYREMFEYGQTDFGPEIVLDNESLYGHFGQDWTKVFLRLPQLPDTTIYYNNGHPENDEHNQAMTPPNSKAKLLLHHAATKCKSVHYLFNKEALQEQLVKVHFLDIHGQSVWFNKIRAEHIQDFEAMPNGGHLLDHLETCRDDPSLLQPGTLLHAEE